MACGGFRKNDLPHPIEIYGRAVVTLDDDDDDGQKEQILG